MFLSGVFALAVEQLTRRGASVRVLTRDPAKASFPEGVKVTKGDLLDIKALRNAFAGFSTLFLLNAVTGEEFT
ncbi:NAD(P)H-binding protein [Methylobacterium sp. SD274]|nr:NAD(P)H-binding protein [Methylobacterium sp. SD274]